MSRKYVSIVIPVYNGANFLHDAIDSALAQTCRDREVIVVNDGSEDGGATETICRSYGGRIRYFLKGNGGVSTALNMGIREMRGEYFTWLAHDDIYYPYKLERQMAALERSPDKTAIVHGNYDLLNVEHGAVSHMRQEDSYSEEQLTRSVFPLLMATVHGAAPLIHRRHFERVGRFDEALPLTQDYDFLFRALRGQQSVFLPEPLLLTRLHPQSGKHTDGGFGLACSEQYQHFADTLTQDEVADMFPSPRAFYCRIAAMMKARADTPAADHMFSRILELPEEKADNSRIIARLKAYSGGQWRSICIFGAGFHGKTLKFELEHRQITTACFCDNDKRKHGAIIGGTVCVSFSELERRKGNILVIIAADVSDEIETQLRLAKFPYIASKKHLDATILECPSSIGREPSL
jgi:glycosyltransferase involved in cell wall biosynthesis